jgi:hypothetical protein
LNGINNQYAGKDVQILAGTIDTEGMPSTKKFIAQFGPNFPIGEGELFKFQAFGGWSPMMRTFVPFIFFIDRKGIIREQHMGSDQAFFSAEAANIRVALDKLLAEGAPAKPGAAAKPATAAPKAPAVKAPAMKKAS